jgi:TldD protein
MIKEEIASKLIDTGLGFGANFVELFVEESRDSLLGYRNHEVESASVGIDFGIGIRVLFGTQVLYAHTSDENEESLIRLVKNLCVGKSGDIVKSIPLVTSVPQNNHPIIKSPRDTALKDRLGFLKEADEFCRQRSDLITQVSVSAIDSSSKIQIINSEGLNVSEERVRSRYTINVTAGQGEERVSAHEAPGASKGFEFFETLNLKEISDSVTDRALRMLEAGYIEGNQMPVVLGNGFGGVIFHEACGHPLETESIRHEASPFCNKIGEKIAHEKVTAIDDGTLVNQWGSINIDDEGMPVQKTTLIENGILKTYLSDRVGAEQVGVPRSGSGRRESYKYAPVSRMRNTFIVGGDDSVDDMISSMEDGLYAKKMGGGSVNPATGEFNFSVEEGFKVKNGKIVEPVRGATLIGKGHEILPRISMVGNDFSLAAGMCGASSGSVPVTVGQPSLKVDKILVGGR